MKILLTVVLCLICLSPLYARECYVFDTQEIAEAALNHINSDPTYPITPDNGLTGKPEPPSVTKHLKWASAAEQRITDGKWYFSRIPKERRDALPPEAIAYFNTTFPHTIETWDSSWEPESEPEI